MPGSRLRRPPGVLALGLAVLIGVAGTIGMKVSADNRTSNITKDEAVVQELQKPANDAPAENYLLVGSDNRTGISPDDPFAAPSPDVVGSRSDTIMIVRLDPGARGEAVKVVQRGLARRCVNKLVGRVKRMFAWAVEEELLPASVHAGLQRVTVEVAPERTVFRMPLMLTASRPSPFVSALSVPDEKLRDPDNRLQSAS